MDNTWDKAQQFDLDYVTWKINRDHILSLEGITVSSLVTFHHRSHKIFRVENTWDQQFNLRKWTGKLKLKREHLLLDGNYVPSLVAFKQRGKKILSIQHLGLKPAVWPWLFLHMAWKSIGVINSLYWIWVTIKKKKVFMYWVVNIYN